MLLSKRLYIWWWFHIIMRLENSYWAVISWCNTLPSYSCCINKLCYQSYKHVAHTIMYSIIVVMIINDYVTGLYIYCTMLFIILEYNASYKNVCSLIYFVFSMSFDWYHLDLTVPCSEYIPTLKLHMAAIIISYWWIGPFIIIKCPFLSLVIVSVLRHFFWY